MVAPLAAREKFSSWREGRVNWRAISSESFLITETAVSWAHDHFRVSIPSCAKKGEWRMTRGCPCASFAQNRNVYGKRTGLNWHVIIFA